MKNATCSSYLSDSVSGMYWYSDTTLTSIATVGILGFSASFCSSLATYNIFMRSLEKWMLFIEAWFRHLLIAITVAGIPGRGKFCWQKFRGNFLIPFDQMAIFWDFSVHFKAFLSIFCSPGEILCIFAASRKKWKSR